MTDLFDRSLWAYRAVFTQAAAGGGSIVISITPKERCLVLFGTIGPDDYAANRTISVQLYDGTQVIGVFMFGTDLDNQRVPILTDNHSALIPNQGFSLEKQLLIAEGDSMRCNAAGLVQNETFTIAIRALIQSSKPAISTAGSGGTVTTAVTYDKVI